MKWLWLGPKCLTSITKRLTNIAVLNYHGTAIPQCIIPASRKRLILKFKNFNLLNQLHFCAHLSRVSLWRCIAMATSSAVSECEMKQKFLENRWQLDSQFSHIRLTPGPWGKVGLIFFSPIWPHSKKFYIQINMIQVSFNTDRILEKGGPHIATCQIFVKLCPMEKLEEFSRVKKKVFKKSTPIQWFRVLAPPDIQSDHSEKANFWVDSTFPWLRCNASSSSSLSRPLFLPKR